MNIVDIIMAKAIFGGGGSPAPSGDANAIELLLSVDDVTGDIYIPNSWTEIRQGFLSLPYDIFLVLNQPGMSGVWMVVDVYENDGTYCVATNSDFVTFETDSADGYPSYTPEG